MTERLVSDRGVFRWRWALPLLPIAASMFCLSALVYYHTAMGGSGTAWGFFQGAVVFLYRWLGFVPAFMLGLLLFVWCSVWFVTGRFENARSRLTWMCVFTLCTAILVNLSTPAEAPAHAGLIGTYIAVRLTSVIGYAFSALLAVAASLASLLLATDFLFYRHFEAMARGRDGDEAGVEPEATDAFRELAFSGVYADEPRAAVVAPEVESSTAVAEPSGSSMPEAAFASDPESGLAVDSDIVVRPRRRRRRLAAGGEDAAVAPAPVPEAEAWAAEPAANGEVSATESEYGSDEAAPFAAYEVPLMSPARGETAGDLAADSYGTGDDDELVDGSSLAGDPGAGTTSPAAIELGDAFAAEPDAAEPDAEPLVEIPRPAAPLRGTLLPFAPSGDLLDLAAREVLHAGRASVTLLRRHLGCSAAEAIETLDALRAAGVIDGEVGSPHGRVVTTLAAWEAR